MKCSKCNQENPDRSKFCTECGNKMPSILESRAKQADKETFQGQSKSKIGNIKSDFQRVAGDTYSKLVNKSKLLKDAIESGKYKKILEHKHVQKIVEWLRKSDERLRIPAYILWCYILLGIFIMLPSVVNMIGLVSHGRIKEAFSQILYLVFLLVIGIPWAGLVYYWMGFFLRKSEKLRNFLAKERHAETFIGGILLWLFYLFPVFFWYVICWPAEKIYGKYFYQFSRLATGIAYANAGDFSKALDELKDAKVSKFDREGKVILHATLADVYIELGRYDNAISQYNTAMQFSAEDTTDLKVGLGASYMLKGQYDEALKLFRNILNTDPENLHVYWGIARCYINMEMYEDALNYLKQAISLQPQDSTSHKMMAEVYLGLDDDNVALREAQLALKYKSDEVIAKEAQDIIDYIQYGTVPEKTTADESSQDTAKSEDIKVLDTKGEKGRPLDILQPVETFSISENVTLFCNNPACKKEIPQDSVFCGYCGTKVVLS